MNIRCKVCANLDYCPASAEEATCGRFCIDIDRLIETAKELSEKHNVEYKVSLDTIDIGLKWGGYVVD